MPPKTAAAKAKAAKKASAAAASAAAAIQSSPIHDANEAEQAMHEAAALGVEVGPSLGEESESPPSPPPKKDDEEEVVEVQKSASSSSSSSGAAASVYVAPSAAPPLPVPEPTMPSSIGGTVKAVGDSIVLVPAHKAPGEKSAAHITPISALAGKSIGGKPSAAKSSSSSSSAAAASSSAPTPAKNLYPSIMSGNFGRITFVTHLRAKTSEDAPHHIPWYFNSHMSLMFMPAKSIKIAKTNIAPFIDMGPPTWACELSSTGDQIIEMNSQNVLPIMFRFPKCNHISVANEFNIPAEDHMKPLTIVINAKSHNAKYPAPTEVGRPCTDSMFTMLENYGTNTNNCSNVRNLFATLHSKGFFVPPAGGRKALRLAGMILDPWELKFPYPAPWQGTTNKKWDKSAVAFQGHRQFYMRFPPPPLMSGELLFRDEPSVTYDFMHYPLNSKDANEACRAYIAAAGGASKLAAADAAAASSSSSSKPKPKASPPKIGVKDSLAAKLALDAAAVSLSLKSAEQLAKNAQEATRLVNAEKGTTTKLKKGGKLIKALASTMTDSDDDDDDGGGGGGGGGGGPSKKRSRTSKKNKKEKKKEKKRMKKLKKAGAASAKSDSSSSESSDDEDEDEETSSDEDKPTPKPKIIVNIAPKRGKKKKEMTDEQAEEAKERMEKEEIEKLSKQVEPKLVEDEEHPYLIMHERVNDIRDLRFATQCNEAPLSIRQLRQTQLIALRKIITNKKAVDNYHRVNNLICVCFDKSLAKRDEKFDFAKHYATLVKYVISGNHRLSINRELFKETKNPKWNSAIITLYCFPAPLSNINEIQALAGTHAVISSSGLEQDAASQFENLTHSYELHKKMYAFPPGPILSNKERHLSFKDAQGRKKNYTIQQRCKELYNSQAALSKATSGRVVGSFMDVYSLVDINTNLRTMINNMLTGNACKHNRPIFTSFTPLRMLFGLQESHAAECLDQCRQLCNGEVTLRMVKNFFLELKATKLIGMAISKFIVETMSVSHKEIVTSLVLPQEEGEKWPRVKQRYYVGQAHLCDAVDTLETVFTGMLSTYVLGLAEAKKNTPGRLGYLVTLAVEKFTGVASADASSLTLTNAVHQNMTVGFGTMKHTHCTLSTPALSELFKLLQPLKPQLIILHFGFGAEFKNTMNPEFKNLPEAQNEHGMSNLMDISWASYGFLYTEKQISMVSEVVAEYYDDLSVNIIIIVHPLQAHAAMAPLIDKGYYANQFIIDLSSATTGQLAAPNHDAVIYLSNNKVVPKIRDHERASNLIVPKVKSNLYRKEVPVIYSGGRVTPMKLTSPGCRGMNSAAAFSILMRYALQGGKQIHIVGDIPGTFAAAAAALQITTISIEFDPVIAHMSHGYACSNMMLTKRFTTEPVNADILVESDIDIESVNSSMQHASSAAAAASSSGPDVTMNSPTFSAAHISADDDEAMDDDDDDKMVEDEAEEGEDEGDKEEIGSEGSEEDVDYAAMTLPELTKAYLAAALNLEEFKFYVGGKKMTVVVKGEIDDEAVPQEDCGHALSSSSSAFVRPIVIDSDGSTLTLSQWQAQDEPGPQSGQTQFGGGGGGGDAMDVEEEDYATAAAAATKDDEGETHAAGAIESTSDAAQRGHEYVKKKAAEMTSEDEDSDEESDDAARKKKTRSPLSAKNAMKGMHSQPEGAESDEQSEGEGK